MTNNDFIEELSNKYGYDEELKIAIGITIPLMINHYGIDKKDEIYDLFRNTRIFATTDMSKENRDRIEQEMIGNANSHLKEEQQDDLYQTNRDPGSYYSYQAIYDTDMNVIGEARWVAVLDMKNSFNGQDYKNTFGTTINIPYFIHEMGHAFGMQKATYRKEDDRIYTKHGMYEQVITCTPKDGKVELESSSSNDVMLEEGVNEFDTQCMLKNFFQVEDYEKVSAILKDIKHVETSYNMIIVALAEKLGKLLGKDRLLQYRRDNDISIIEEFNLVASQSDIAKKHCGDVKPFDMLDQKVYALFLLSNKKLSMSFDEYGRRNGKLMMDGYAPLCAYQDKKYGTMPPSLYEEVRNNALGIQTGVIEVKEESMNKKV